uniref:DUF1553 domain-containing protein n=1 Tax=Schlesneria paludicola TaxID=360056 RepID=A0A7C2NZV7_9PLAN
MSCLRFGITVIAGLLVASPEAESGSVSFRYEVLPILTKAGCNQGTCHGTPTGKNGFRLSLRGFDPTADWNSLAREANGRRINRVDVEQSLILLKGLNGVPHEGGRRLDRESADYQRLRQWIAEGARDDGDQVPALRQLTIQPERAELEAPLSTQALQVTAHFADGSQRNVTALCRWSSSDSQVAAADGTGLVTKQRRGEATITAEFCGQFASSRLLFREPVPDFRWPEIAEHNAIDRLVFAKLKQLQIEPSPVSSDAVFLRRVMIDLTGQIPHPNRVREFLADSDPNKRTRLIDELLDSPAFADWWAMKWADRLGSNQRYTGKFGAMKYHAWIRAAMAENVPEDVFVHTLLTASGPNYEHPPASFWRRMRVGGIGTDVDAELAAEEVSQLFLGVRIQCARCHNHPGERWTQEDFHGLVAFFKPLKFKQGDFFDNIYDKEDVVYFTDPVEVRHPRTGAVVPPTLLDAGPVAIAPGNDPRETFARWLTAPDNRWFARNSVNRLWYHLFGRGLVDPVDDVRDSNPPSHPEVLDLLAREFVSSGYDRKQILRLIAQSQVYQLDSRVLPSNAEDRRYFSRAQVRLLSAEALLDAVSQATEVAESFPNVPPGTRAAELPNGEYKHPFLEAFGRPARALACECERDASTNFQQALQLVSGQTVMSKLHSDAGRAARLASSTLSPAEIVDELFLATLSRFPDSAEREFLLPKLDPAADRRAAIEDLLWMLLNHREFLFVH